MNGTPDRTGDGLPDRPGNDSTAETGTPGEDGTVRNGPPDSGAAAAGRGHEDSAAGRTAHDGDTVRGGATPGGGSVLAHGLRLGFGTFTALPTPHPRTVDTPQASVAILTAALPGATLGLIGAATGVGAARLGVPEPAAAALAVGAVQLACRGFHLDGLGDTADGLASGHDRERALTIMRRGDSGPAAVATTVLVLLVQVSALAAVLHRPTWQAAAAVLAAVALSRAWLVVPCLRPVPTARAQGLGAGVGRSVRPLPAALSTTLVTLAATGLLGVAGWPVWAALVASLVAGLVSGLLVWHVVRRLGGVTGDVMGAVVEIALAALLLTLSIL